jgi:hypothetical protein
MPFLIPGFVLSGSLLGQALEQSPVSQKSEPKQVSKLGFIQDEKTRVWYHARALQLEGKGWAESGYGRLPSRAKGVVRDPVWELGQDSAGLCARFSTDAKAISARWTLRSQQLAMDHMPATGVSGLDLYVRGNGKWNWLAVGRPTQFPTNEVTLVHGLSEGLHEYLLYFPLYNGVQSVEVGIPRGAIMTKAPERVGRYKTICFYGTSITQGGCASRPGMAYTAVLVLMLDQPTINLGFSGNGPMDLEMAGFLAELDPAIYVIDSLPNMEAAMVTERAKSFVTILRRARPETPIVLVENITYQNAEFVSSRDSYVAKNVALRETYQRLIDGGIKNLHYLRGDDLLGHDGEATVDGTHPTDLGFVRMAEAMYPVLSRLLK